MSDAPSPGWFVTVPVALTGVTTLGFGVWSWAAPQSFADFVDFPVHLHFLHDAGVFQIGIGIGLLASLVLHDALVVVLASFTVANTLHVANHVVDLDQGGTIQGAVALGVLSVISAVGLVFRSRQLTHLERSRT